MKSSMFCRCANLFGRRRASRFSPAKGEGSISSSALVTNKAIKSESAFADGDLSKFEERHLVPVLEPWKVLLDFIIGQKERTALIRAPPRSGKSFLGQLAAQQPSHALGDANVEVRFCPNVANQDEIDLLLARGPFQSITRMAEDSCNSADDEKRKTIVYFFDEAHEIPRTIIDAFVNKGDKNGYAVFATAGKATQEANYNTPRELVEKTFYYRSPSPLEKMREWLSGRLAAVLDGGMSDPDVQAAADLVMNMAAGHIGVITFLGRQVENSGRKQFSELRDVLRKTLKEASELYPRVFGTQNGTPDAMQAELISMLRCSGSLNVTTPEGRMRVWDPAQQSHRRGLSRAYFAPQPPPDSSSTLTPMKSDEVLTFVHPSQPEIYEIKFKYSWPTLRHQERWVRNFSRDEDMEPCESPTHVIDLVLSWLSHVETDCLLYVEDNVDPAEGVFQRSFDMFTKGNLRIAAAREVKTEGGGRLDHLVDKEMGIEMLIRSSSNNKIKSRGLLSNAETKSSLIEHASRGEGQYKSIAEKCAKGYITVLVATLTKTSPDDEWKVFEALVKDSLSTVSHPVLVAVAPFGWAKWHVFLHRPGKAPIRLQIPRHRLMFKLVDDKAVTARDFFPKPDVVWAQELDADDWKLKGRAFKVKPEADDIASLAKAVKGEDPSLTCAARALAIYTQNRSGKWVEVVKPSQVLYANTDAKPYGFVVP